MEELHAVTKKPVLIGEFSFTAKDSVPPLPNRKGARACFGPICLPGCPYETQSQRGEAYTRYVSALASKPYVIGWHWSQWVDEPLIGRWPDGENSNYGLVSIDDEPYSAVVETMQQVNAEVESMHRSATPLKRVGESGVVAV